jgi:tetratricopeptide (TPR) repeat protein
MTRPAWRDWRGATGVASANCIGPAMAGHLLQRWQCPEGRRCRESVKAWIDKGNALWGLKRYQEAEAAYDGATTHDPNDAAAWYNKRLAREQLKRNAQAPAVYERGFGPARRPRLAWQGALLASAGPDA